MEECKLSSFLTILSSRRYHISGVIVILTESHEASCFEGEEYIPVFGVFE